MRLRPDDDALEFAASVGSLLADAADSLALRAAWDSDDGRVPMLWQRLVDVGVPAMTVPEEYGGLGLDLRAAVPALEECGRAAVPEPVVETVVGAAILAAADGPVAKRWLPEIAAGAATVGLGLGPGELVTAASWAQLLVLQAPDGTVHAIEVGDARVNPKPTADRGVRLARVDWQPEESTALPASPALGVDLAVTGVAAQQVGLARAMLAMSVRYALQREQFGRPIGSFQAVKHQLADLYVDIGFAAPVVARAAWSASTAQPSASVDASHARLAATRAADTAARTALQVHAGIGYTYEHDLHIWMKRSWTLASLYGGSAWHRARVAEALLGDGSTGKQ